ncbi:hypothetical protein ACQ4PT_033206 [Festuca glaucescens]
MRSLPREQEKVVKELRARITNLKKAGLTAANLYNCWLARRLVPLRCRGHYMWEYTGQNDCTRVSATEWAEAEYKKALAKITTAPFTSFDAELQPFTADNPGPTTWREVANHLPPLTGEEPAEMTAGEEDTVEEEEEDEGERTESDSEALSQEPADRARGTKRGATPSSQTSLEEDIEEEEEATSSPEGKAPVDPPSERRAKRLRQMTFMETGINLQRPVGDVLRATERVQPGVRVIPTVRAKLKVLKKATPVWEAAATKAAEAKKAAEEAAGVRAAKAKAKEAAEAEAAKAKVAKATRAKAKETTEAEASKTATAAGQEHLAARGAEAPSGSGPTATGAAPHKERRSKLAGDPALAKEPTPSEMGAAEGARKDASTDAAVRGTNSEEVTRRAAAYPVPSLSFAEMHRALGDLHVREMNELGAEIRRLNTEVEEAATKNRQLISIGKAREKALAQARVGYVAEAEVAAKVKEAVDRANAAERAAKRAQSEVDKLVEVLNGKAKELEEVVEAHKAELEAASKAKTNKLTAVHAKELEALKKAHAAELELERETSKGTILALQKEKTTFEVFVREASRQLLGESLVYLCLSCQSTRESAMQRAREGESPSMVSSRGRVPERGELMGASPRAWRAREGDSPSVVC